MLVDLNGCQMNATDLECDGDADRPKSIDRTAPLWERIEIQRERLLKGFAVIECCRYASRSTRPAPETMADALQVACDLIDWATSELHEIASDAQEQAKTSTPPAASE